MAEELSQIDGDRLRAYKMMVKERRKLAWRRGWAEWWKKLWCKHRRLELRHWWGESVMSHEYSIRCLDCEWTKKLERDEWLTLHEVKIPVADKSKTP